MSLDKADVADNLLARGVGLAVRGVRIESAIEKAACIGNQGLLIISAAGGQITSKHTATTPCHVDLSGSYFPIFPLSRKHTEIAG
jgi:hypothetical protein